MDEREFEARLDAIRVLVAAAQSSLNEAYEALAALRRDIQAAKAEKASGEMRRWPDGSALLTVERVAL